MSDQKLKLFKLVNDNSLLVAIPEVYLTTIDAAIEEYGSIEKVPHHKTVRGIFVKSDQIKNLNSNDQQNDITICQLRPN